MATTIGTGERPGQPICADRGRSPHVEAWPMLDPLLVRSLRRTERNRAASAYRRFSEVSAVQLAPATPQRRVIPGSEGGAHARRQIRTCRLTRRQCRLGRVAKSGLVAVMSG